MPLTWVAHSRQLRRRRHPAHHRGGGIRHYAGIPLQGSQGREFGALCVTDFRPRTVTSSADMSVLRKLASAAQHSIWNATLGEGGRVASLIAGTSSPASPAEVDRLGLRTPA